MSPFRRRRRGDRRAGLSGRPSADPCCRRPRKRTAGGHNAPKHLHLRETWASKRQHVTQCDWSGPSTDPLHNVYRIPVQGRKASKNLTIKRTNVHIPGTVGGHANATASGPRGTCERGAVIIAGDPVEDPMGAPVEDLSRESCLCLQIPLRAEPEGVGLVRRRRLLVRRGRSGDVRENQTGPEDLRVRQRRLRRHIAASAPMASTAAVVGSGTTSLPVKSFSTAVSPIRQPISR